MTWDDKMSVGVKRLDDDHKRLIAMVNELHDGILEGHRKEALGHVLDELVKYTKIHFMHEEEIFTRTNYPGGAAHKREHDDLVAKAADLQERFKTGPTSMLSLEVMNFLKAWLNHHIGGSDKAYTKHMHANGIH